MNNKKKLFEQDENKVPSNRPLSNEELGRVIKASKDKSFKSIEIKKEKEEGFKKVSLHDIAKQANAKNIKFQIIPVQHTHIIHISNYYQKLEL